MGFWKKAFHCVACNSRLSVACYKLLSLYKVNNICMFSYCCYCCWPLVAWICRLLLLDCLNISKWQRSEEIIMRCALSCLQLFWQKFVTAIYVSATVLAISAFATNAIITYLIPTIFFLYVLYFFCFPSMTANKRFSKQSQSCLTTASTMGRGLLGIKILDMYVLVVQKFKCCKILNYQLFQTMVFFFLKITI